MPVTILVRSGEERRASNEATPSLTFEGERVVIGRGGGSDVRLPDPSVSTRHATLRAQGADYAIVDEESTNGTWVGGVRLPPRTPRVVRTGDLVRCGKVWLEIVVGHRPPTPDLALATRELALALVRRAMDASGDDTRVRVRVVEGRDTGAELVLEEEALAYVVGRAETCALPLEDDGASREHAQIVRRGSQVFLRDLGAKNGVFLGEQRLTAGRDVTWKGDAMVRIGATVLALEEPAADALAELEAMPDERLPDVTPPPPPPSSSVLPAAEPSTPAVEPAPVSRAAAPIADVALPTPKAAIPARRSWTSTDLLVVGLAMLIITASLAGLVWIVRG